MCKAYTELGVIVPKGSLSPKGGFMGKAVTKSRNKKTIMIYYSIALIFVSIGLFTSNAQWYVIAVAL